MLVNTNTTTRVWDAFSGGKIQTFNRQLNDFSFSANREKILSLDISTIVSIYDASTLKILQLIPAV